jgi:hypothetical protein
MAVKLIHGSNSGFTCFLYKLRSFSFSVIFEAIFGTFFVRRIWQRFGANFLRDFGARTYVSKAWVPGIWNSPKFVGHLGFSGICEIDEKDSFFFNVFGWNRFHVMMWGCGSSSILIAGVLACVGDILGRNWAVVLQFMNRELFHLISSPQSATAGDRSCFPSAIVAPGLRSIQCIHRLPISSQSVSSSLHFSLLVFVFA